MLASDVVWNARASRTLSADQIAAMDRLLFSNGAPTRDQIELFDLIDSYMIHRCNAWAALVERVRACATKDTAEPILAFA